MANTKLEIANAALRSEITERVLVEESLRLILESTRAIPWEADAKTWAFTYVGPQAVDLLGYPLERWLEPDFWPTVIHPDDRDEAIQFCIASSKTEMHYEFDYRMITRDDKVIWIHDIVHVVTTDGEPTALRGFMIDISDRKRAEEQARRLRDELAHVSRVTTMGEFAASLAHELNQPLCGIVSNAQAGERLLAAGDEDTQAIRDTLRDIVDDGKRAGEVIRRLRAMLKRTSFEPISLDIGEVIREVARLVMGDALAKGITLNLDLALDLPKVMGDRTQLQQVLVNLILNGIEAMGGETDGSREILIGTARHRGDAVTIAVRDTGLGFEEKNVDRIFDAFFTTKPEGMGMGLSINRSIIEAHGGRIWATLNPHGGATVHFTVPILKEVSP
ncbi:MAG: ATP-binding protein [Planctomycetota bacterium]|nr:ATP-binding protein [Planctomycetota bacterium]